MSKYIVLPAYRTVSGVNGPLVILDNVKVTVLLYYNGLASLSEGSCILHDVEIGLEEP